MRIRNFYPLTCSNFFFQILNNFKQYFIHTGLLCVQIYLKLQRVSEIILKFDKLTPCYARSPKEFLHFTMHLPQHTNFCYLAINKRLKQTNYWGVTVSETCNKIQWKYFFKKFIYIWCSKSPPLAKTHAFKLRNFAASHPINYCSALFSSRMVFNIAPNTRWSYNWNAKFSSSSCLTRHNFVKLKNNWIKLRSLQ